MVWVHEQAPPYSFAETMQYMLPCRPSSMSKNKTNLQKTVLFSSSCLHCLRWTDELNWTFCTENVVGFLFNFDNLLPAAAWRRAQWMWTRPAAGRRPNEDHVICPLSILWARLIVELNTRLFPDTGATGDRGRAACEFRDCPDNVKPSLGVKTTGVI